MNPPPCCPASISTGRSNDHRRRPVVINLMPAQRRHLILAASCVVAFIATVYAAADGVVSVPPAAVLDGSYQARSPWFAPNLAIHVGAHAAVALALLFLAFRTLREASSPGPLVAALTFALFPVCVDTVAWRFGGGVLFSSLFTVLAVLSHSRGGIAGRTGALAALVLALSSSESALCIPAVLVAYDLLFRGRPRRAWTASYAGMVVVLAGFFALRHAAGTRLVAGGVESLRALLDVGAVYLPRVILPLRLQAFEAHAELPGQLVAIPAVIAMAATAALITLALRRPGGRTKTLAFGWSWFLIGLVPAAIRGSATGELGDRFAYLPALGLALMAAAGVNAVFDRLSTLPRWRRWWVLAAGGLGVVWATLGLSAARRVQDWRSTRALFEAELRNQTDNPIAHRALAVIEAGQGRHREAMTHVRHVQRVAPNAWATWRVSCCVALGIGHLEEAERACTKGRDIAPRNPKAWIQLARLRAQGGRWHEAVDACETALRCQAEPVDTAYCRALDAIRTGNAVDAHRRVRHALQIDDEHDGALELLRLMAKGDGGRTD